jgi:hypothetical protein
LKDLIECRILEGICTVLTPIAQALQFLEGDNYPTLSFVQLLGFILNVTIQKAIDQELERALQNSKLLGCFRELKKQLYDRFSYFPLHEYENYMPVDYLAAVLDPRTKTLDFITDEEKEYV